MKQKAPLELAIDYGLLFTLALIFGMSFIWGKVAVREVPPATIVFCRLILGAAILFTCARIAGEKLLPLFAHWRPIFLVGVFSSALPFFLITWGQEQVDAALTSTLMAIMPLMTIVLAHYFSDGEDLNAFKVVGFMFGLVGVAILFGLENLTSLGEDTIRQLAIIAASLCYAINAIISKLILGLPRFAVSTAVLIAPAIVMLPFVLVFDQPWQLELSSASYWSLLALGIFPTGLGLLMVFTILERQGAGFISQINFLVPVVGAVAAVVFLGEIVPPNAWLSLAIILAGVAIARIKPKSKPVENAQ